LPSADYQTPIEVDPQSIVSSIITDSGISDVSDTNHPQSSTTYDRSSTLAPVNSATNLNAQSAQQTQQQQHQQQPNVGEMGHSRNSSNTSQVSNFKIDKKAVPQ
jgi:hypothetical protein